MLFNGPDNPQKLPLPLGDLVPIRVYPPIGISIGSALFANCRAYRHRPCYFVCSNSYCCGANLKPLYSSENNTNLSRPNHVIALIGLYGVFVC